MRGHRALLLVVALFAETQVAASLPAQGARSVTVGVIGGVATTSLVGKDAADDLERRIGVLAGLSAVFATPSRFQIEIDGLYATKGWRSSGQSSTLDFTASYVEMPVLLRLSLARGARIRPFLTVGPAFGMRIACNSELTSSIGTEKLTCDEFERNADVEVGKTDLSTVVGAGVVFPLGSIEGTLAARYSRGLSSVIGDRDNHFQSFSVQFGIAKARR